MVAKGEFAAGFAVPSYMAFEERLAGFDIKFVAPKTACDHARADGRSWRARKHPKAARAFIEFLLTERGQRVFMERGPVPDHAEVQACRARPGSPAEMAVEFTGGVRSYFDARGDEHLRRRQGAGPLRRRSTSSSARDIEAGLGAS